MTKTEILKNITNSQGAKLTEYISPDGFVWKMIENAMEQYKLASDGDLADVVGQSEQLVCDYKYHNRDITTNGECTKCESHKWR